MYKHTDYLLQSIGQLVKSVHSKLIEASRASKVLEELSDDF